MQTMRTSTIRLIGYLCCVCVTGMTGMMVTMARAQQAPAVAPSSTLDMRLFKSVAFGFEVPIPVLMRIDTLSQKVVEAHAIPMAHSWSFIQAQPPSKADPHWQRMLINAHQGMGIEEAEWNRYTASRFRQARDKAPKGSMVDSVVRWSADTVEMRLGMEDPVKGEFLNERCLGANVGGRSRTIVVCVQTSAETAEALAPVRDGLVLIPRNWR